MAVILSSFNGKLNLMYPLIIIFAILIIIAIFFVLKQRQKFKKGIIIANTKYVKNTKYYRELMRKYQFYKIAINLLSILGILLCAFLVSRINYATTYEDDANNRDIMLCMDVSQSVDELNSKLITELKSTVSGLSNDRFGITIFDGLPVSIIPLTTDYNYVINYLERFENAYITRNNQSYFTSFLYAGTEDEGRGHSLIGEGLAYCASTFKKDDERTKVIILSTDNDPRGESIVSLDEAATYAKNNNIKVYGIGTADIKPENKIILQNAVNKTNGEYFDAGIFQPKQIIDKINELNTSSLKANSYVIREDAPQLIFIYFLIIIFILYLINWRIKI